MIFIAKIKIATYMPTRGRKSERVGLIYKAFRNKGFYKKNRNI